jgi:hypothetical protein
MTEKLLQFIWQYQYFNKQSLATTKGNLLQVNSAGVLNSNQGPDFHQARIIIDQTLWAGTVELHIRSSDWLRHKHQHNDRYDKVILHVVWQHDMPINDVCNNEIPCLELQPRISQMLLYKYDQWMTTPVQIPCNQSILQVPDIIWQVWKERLAIERLMSKYEHIQQHLTQTNTHWEEVFWRMLCRYFGGNINGESFEQIAISLPIQILAKHKTQIHQLEALLLGQAGLLHRNFEEDYPKLLYREYQFLQKKYQLQVINLPPSFLRMRPTSFPTVRLAQLAMLVHTSQHLFSKIKEAESPSNIKPLINITANDYWHYHYRFDEASDYLPKNTGSQLFDTLLINCFAPMLFAYGVCNNDTSIKEKALQWLSETSTEKNSVIAPFVALGLKPANAFDSQALIQLKKQYCDAKRCLECSIGNAILKRSEQV